jgi:hypothetical protein
MDRVSATLAEMGGAGANSRHLPDAGKVLDFHAG